MFSPKNRYFFQLHNYEAVFLARFFQLHNYEAAFFSPFLALFFQLHNYEAAFCLIIVQLENRLFTAAQL